MTKVKQVIEWIRKNAGIIALALVCILFAFGAYSFIGGYGLEFGETFAGSYSSFTRSVQSYTVIDAMLHDFLVQYNASRMGIARFHNSIHDIGNNSLFFVSFEQLLAAPGVNSDLEAVANQPATVYSSILPAMLEDKTVVVYTKQLPQGPFKELSVRRGDKVMVFVPIRDLTDKLIGMMALSWISALDIPPQGPKRDAMIKSLQDAAIRVGGYLSAVNR